MIPILYRNEEKNFVTNGIGRLSDCISCTVTEERNGAYECEFKYPISGERYNDIVNGCIIYCTHDETQIPQAFEIYGHSAPINGVVTFYAHHISYKLRKLVAMPFTATSIQDAFVKLKQNIPTANSFDFWTDKTTVGNYKLDVPTTARGILGGQENSILDVYGKGDYEWDMFTVKLHQNRGADSGVEIRYGKNLIDVVDDVDGSDVYNAVAPFWKAPDESGVVTLPEAVLVYSEATKRIVDLTDHLLNILRTHNQEPLEATISIKEVVPLDLTQEFEEKPTVAQLRSRAVSILESSGGWNPNQNITVDFVALWQTEEYKDFAPLQRVRLCDTVSVYYPELGVEAVKKKVVKTTYNVLLEKYDKIELGDLQYSFSQVVVESLKEDVPTNSMMQNAIDNATKLISGGLGGHVYLKPNANGHPEEMLIMDDEDYTQATKLWRWNLNGLGYSDTGYNGYYGTAITMDGQIVADYITTGTLNANIIKAGMLSDVNGNTEFNLDTGLLTMKRGSIDLGNGTFYVDDNGRLIANSVEIGGFKLTDEADGAYAFYQDSLVSGRQYRTWIRSATAKDGEGHTQAFAVQVLSGTDWETVFGVNASAELYASPRASYSSISESGRLLVVNKDYAQIGYSNANRVLLNASGCNMTGGSTSYYVNVDSTKSSIVGAKSYIDNTAYGMTIVTGRSTTAHSGNLYITGAGIAYFANEGSSSKYVKHDIKLVENDELKAENLYNIDVIQYKYNDDFLSEDDPNRGKDLVGFIVEDLDKVYPCAVQKESEENSKTWTWSPYRIIPAMLKLIQDQHTEIERLKQRLS